MDDLTPPGMWIFLLLNLILLVGLLVQCKDRKKNKNKTSQNQKKQNAPSQRRKKYKIDKPSRKTLDYEQLLLTYREERGGEFHRRMAEPTEPSRMIFREVDHIKEMVGEKSGEDINNDTVVLSRGYEF